MLNTNEREHATKTGFKLKKGVWYDKQGFIVSESEIRDYYNEVKDRIPTHDEFRQAVVNYYGNPKTL